MKFSYSTANLIFFGFLIILLILPIFDRHKIGKFQTQKSLLGIRLWAITYLPIERARCLPQINAIKFLGNPAGKMFERQTKATLEVKTRHFVRHSAADIPLPLPLEHHPTLGQKWVTHSPSRSEQVRWCEETAIAGYIYPKHLHFLEDKCYI